MNQHNDLLLCFVIDDQRFAISINTVRRVIRAVAVSPVPDADKLIYGMMDFHGQVIPIINLRERFNLTPKPVEVGDRFVIVDKNSKMLALVVDDVEELLTATSNNINTIELPSAKQIKDKVGQMGLEIRQFLSDERGIIVIYDIEKLLGSEAEIVIQDFFNSIEK